jgi:NADPH:quinone reductase-like Zn-dependent oxidoreductase
METTIRKVLVTRFGDESVLEVIEAKIASPQAGEVQVQVLHSVVAGSDVNMRRGTYPFQKKPPFTPGYSMVGKVLDNGVGCTRFAPGTLVACLTIYGAQAERMIVPEKFVLPVPEGLDLRQAAALILEWMTAYGMLEHSAKVMRGQRVFVHGLSGAVGTAFLHLSQLRGAEVFGTASASKHAELSATGAVV